MQGGTLSFQILGKKVQLTQLYKTILPTSCDCLELLQNSTECRRRMGKSYLFVSKIFEFSENQSIVSFFQKAPSLGQFQKRGCNSIDCKPRIHNLRCLSREEERFVNEIHSSRPAMNCSQTFTNLEGMKKEKSPEATRKLGQLQARWKLVQAPVIPYAKVRNLAGFSLMTPSKKLTLKTGSLKDGQNFFSVEDATQSLPLAAKSTK